MLHAAMASCSKQFSSVPVKIILVSSIQTLLKAAYSAPLTVADLFSTTSCSWARNLRKPNMYSSSIQLLTLPFAV